MLPSANVRPKSKIQPFIERLLGKEKDGFGKLLAGPCGPEGSVAAPLSANGSEHNGVGVTTNDEKN